MEVRPMSVTPDELREVAVKRVRERHDFASHVVAFVVINLGLVAVWAVTGQGYFWPGWILGGWGIGVVLHGWDVFLRQPITEADVDREVERLAHRSHGAR
jgi:2TM domain